MNRPLPPNIAAAVLAVILSVLGTAPALGQDNILIYGNSIIEGRTPLYLSDLIVEATGVAPHLVTHIAPDLDTADYVANAGLIASGLPPGQKWDAMIVQGGTFETTTQFGYNPADFHDNMIELAGKLYVHSPQGVFLGHETGADHPNSNRYPALFPDAAAWLALSQVAYEAANQSILSTYPSNPKSQIIRQGTVFANTAGYPGNLFTNDDHHHNKRGQILDALLHYQGIYGGRLCDLNVNFSHSTPLVNRLVADSITPQAWDRLVGFADRSLSRVDRLLPGTDSDFQLRVGVNTSVENLCTDFVAASGDTLNLECVSPLGSATIHVAIVHQQLLPSGVLPAASYPGFHLDLSQMSTLAAFSNLNGALATSTIPGGLSGSTIWLQASSRASSGSATYPTIFSDAKRIKIQ